MITGSLRKTNYKIITKPSTVFVLGIGHINFFKDKLLYLKNRLEAVNNEMSRRNFKNSTCIDLDEFPKILTNDWKPSIKDSLIVRERVSERLIARKAGQPGSEYYRYYRKLIGTDILSFAKNILNLSLYKV